jgi:hypothetical protein
VFVLGPDSTLLWDSLDVEYPISLRVASNFDFLSYNWSRVGQVGKKCVRLRKFKKSCLQLPLKYVRTSTSRVYASPVSYAVESKYNRPIPLRFSYHFTYSSRPIMTRHDPLPTRTSNQLHFRPFFELARRVAHERHFHASAAARARGACLRGRETRG